MSSRQVSLAVVGGGPAGLSAAAHAAKLGVDTVVLDLHAQTGGHYFNLPPDELQPGKPGSDLTEGKSLIEQAKQAGAEILSGAQVWGIYPEDPFRICISGNHLKEIRARSLILAPGAVERVWPFPGWTLPGVVTAGGALTLMKSQGILPGRRVLISGTGPLQLSLAALLASHHADIAGLLELKLKSEIMGAFRSPGPFAAQFPRIMEGLRYLLELGSKRIPYLFGWSVVRALGGDQVRGAVIAQIDAAGKPVPGTEKTIDLDCICLGHGLLPDTQLTRLLECTHILHPQLPAWVPVRDEWLQTSLPGVFAVGDAADICGKTAAVLEGRIAALAAACQMGRLDEAAAKELSAPLQQKLGRERRFAQALGEIFSLPKDPAFLAEADTIICRCECVTYQQVREAISDGASSVQAVKYHSRAGMGWCRGTTCAALVSQIIAQQTGLSLEHASRLSTRPPLFPVPLDEALTHEGLN